MAYIGAEPLPGQNREVDDISSSFNGSTTAFTLQVSGVNVSPESANNILVNLGGVLQNPGTDYTIAASTLTFTTAPASGLSFFALVLGAGINTATVADQTIGTSKVLDNAITADKLAHTSVTAGSYTTADITVDAQGRITAAASGTIANAEIADNAVTTAKIADSTGASDGVTTAKIATSAITTAKIADQAVDLSKLPHGTGSNDGKFLRANNGADPTFETVTGTTINTNADNRVITGSGTANTLNGEANLTFDGANLLLNSTSGNVLFGETTAYNTFENSSTNPRLQVRGTNLNGSCQAWIRATADAGAPKLFIANTRNTSSNGHTIVQSNDELGGLFFAGSDGSQFVNGASISAIVNGTPGADDVPGALLFGTNAGAASTTERMRITANGNVGINQTNPQAKFNVTVGTNINFQVSNTNARVERSFSGGSSTDEDGMWFVDNDSTTGTYIRFWQTVGGAHQIGSISHSTSSTSYNTSSDYRLKENIISISDGITRLKTLKPSRFNFIGESETVDGFIAHEVTAVPESITGTKDEVAETDAPELGLKKGDPIYQGIDQSKLVPLLTAALQEAVTKIEILETKVAALEAA